MQRCFVRLFVEFLRKEFKVVDEDIRMKISVYLEDKDIKEVEKYWKNEIGLSSPVMRKHLIDPINRNKVKEEDRKNRIHKLPYGVCTLYLRKSTRAIQHIYGALEIYAGVCLDPHRRRSSQVAFSEPCL